MMVLGLLSLMGSLISALPVEGPAFDPSFFEMVDTGWNYIMTAIDILGVFIGPVGMRAIGLFLAFVMALNLFYMGWQVFWFVIKKIPMLNVNP